MLLGLAKLEILAGNLSTSSMISFVSISSWWRWRFVYWNV